MYYNLRSNSRFYILRNRTFIYNFKNKKMPSYVRYRIPYYNTRNNKKFSTPIYLKTQ